MDFTTLLAIFFLTLVGAYLIRDRKNIEFQYILIMRRTKKGVKYLDKISKWHPKFWNVIGYVSIPVAIYLMFSGLSVIGTVTNMIIQKELTTPGLAPVLPSLEPGVHTGFGGYVFFIPFWFWILLVATLLIPHEIMHGIIARSVKIPVRSMGFLVLLVLPGAFVEPDEKKLKNAKMIPRLKVFSAGSFANFLIYLFVLFLLQFVLFPTVVQSVGVPLYNVTEGTPAYSAGLTANMTLLEINGVPFDKNAGDPLSEALQGLNPGDTITIKAKDNGTEKLFPVTLAKHPDNASKPYIGVITYIQGNNTKTVIAETKYMSVKSAEALFLFLALLGLFSYTVAMINLLPWKPFDGGLIAQTILEGVTTKNNARLIANGLSVVILALVLFGMFGPELIRFLK